VDWQCFKTLGYQISNDIQITNETLSYTILRPIYIPIIGNNVTVGSNAMGQSIIRYDSTSTASYDINFSCKVIFNLKNGIAKSIQYQGRAC